MSPEDIALAGELMNMNSSRRLLTKYLREKTGKAVTTRDLANINSNMKRQSLGIDTKKVISNSKSRVGPSDPGYRGKAALPEDIAEKTQKRKATIIRKSRHKVESTGPQSDNNESDGSDLDGKTGKAVTTQDLANVNTTMKRQSLRINMKKATSSSKSKVGTSDSDPGFGGNATLPEDSAGKSKASTIRQCRYEVESTCPQSDKDESDGSDFDVSPEPGLDAGQWLSDHFEDADTSDRGHQVIIIIM